MDSQTIVSITQAPASMLLRVYLGPTEVFIRDKRVGKLRGCEKLNLKLPEERTDLSIRQGLQRFRFCPELTPGKVHAIRLEWTEEPRFRIIRYALLLLGVYLLIHGLWIDNRGTSLLPFAGICMAITATNPILKPRWTVEENTVTNN